MLRKFTCGATLVPLGICSQVLVIIGLALLLRAGSGPIAGDLPTDAGRYLVLINAEAYSMKVGSVATHGLPDSHDFSKPKDFFGVFPSLYCSGKMYDDNKYKVDFCSKYGKEFFDQQRVWRVWGVNLIDDQKLIGTTPKAIFIGLTVSAGVQALGLMVGIAGFCSYWAAMLAAILSVITSIATISVASTSQVFVDRLVKGIRNLEESGSGKITASYGTKGLATLWLVAIFSFLATVAWISAVVRFAKARNRDSKNPANANGFGGLVRRTTGMLAGINKNLAMQKTTYKHLGDEQEMLGMHSRNHSQTELFPGSQLDLSSRSRPNSPGPQEPDSRLDRSRVRHDETAYEPFRHRELGP